MCSDPSEIKQKCEQIREVLTVFYSEISNYKYQTESKHKLIETYKAEIEFKKLYCQLLKTNMQKSLEALQVLNHKNK